MTGYVITEYGMTGCAMALGTGQRRRQAFISIDFLPRQALYIPL